MPTLTQKSFARIFKDNENSLPPHAKQLIRKTNFKYRAVEHDEYIQIILFILKKLDSDSLKVSGPHRLKDWEQGWNEHLQEFAKSKYDTDQLVGRFANRGSYIRLQGNLIKPENDSFESNFVAVIRFYLFSKYFKNIKALYEFGAGTGVNLVAASEIFPELKLVGLDWAGSSVDLINSLSKKVNKNISGKKFDLFRPDNKYLLDKHAGVFTVGTLEQLGDKFKPFIQYLLKNKPVICIHLETMYELYDQENLLDYLAAKYLEKRNYLQGFLPYLKMLEKEKKIEILETRRTFGSTFHEGYTYTIWKPL